MATHLSLACVLLLTLAGITDSTPRHSQRLERSDDVTLTSMEKLVQQQAAVIQTLQIKLTADENKYSALESRVESQASEISVLKSRLAAVSKAVAFSVRFSDDDGSSGIPLGRFTTLKFDKIVTNYGNGYNPHTGIFTAPVAGIYVFFLSQMVVNSHHDLHLAIVKDNQVLDLAHTEGSVTNDQGSSQVTTHLTTGQQVWVRQSSGDAVRGSWYTIFTGYLLQAD